MREEGRGETGVTVTAEHAGSLDRALEKLILALSVELLPPCDSLRTDKEEFPLTYDEEGCPFPFSATSFSVEEGAWSSEHRKTSIEPWVLLRWTWRLSAGSGTSSLVSAGALTTMTVWSFRLGILFTSSYDMYANVPRS